MGEKVAKLGLKRELDFLYHVKEGDVWATPKKKPGWPRGPDRKVATLGVAMDPAYIYFLDDDGDVARRKNQTGCSADETRRSTDHREAERIHHPVTPEEHLDFLGALGEEFCVALASVVELEQLCPQDGYEVFIRAFERDPSPQQLSALTPAEFEMLRTACIQSVGYPAISLEHIQTWVARTLCRCPAHEG